MKEILYKVAGGYGKVVRVSKVFALGKFKADLGILILDRFATIGKHRHYGKRHCEIYFTCSRNVTVNKLHVPISVCHEAEHEAENISRWKYGVIIFAKLWW